jgi:hypothetical protein
MHSIPTYYQGTRYRSRLEARWAAFFARLGWLADYEPLDLVGYIPDFVLRFERPCVVEVKPVLGLADLEHAARKVDAWEGDALILGSVLHWSTPTLAAPISLTDEAGQIRRAPAVVEAPCSVTIGRMRIEGFWFDARLGRTTLGIRESDGFGPLADREAWRAPSEMGMEWYISPRATLEHGASDVRMAFASAGNDTQWNRPRSPWRAEIVTGRVEERAPLKIEYVPRRDRW